MMLSPAQTGVDAVATGAAGIGLTVTVTMPAGPMHVPVAAVTL